MDITPAQQYYLRAIHELTVDGEGARLSDIAAKVGVKKSSACTALKTLQRKKLVKRDASRKVLLTPEGTRQGACMAEKYTTIQRFLMKILKINNATACGDAGAMVHLVSPETCRCLHECMGSSCSIYQAGEMIAEQKDKDGLITD